jgi:hypothetical protein
VGRRTGNIKSEQLMNTNKGIKLRNGTSVFDKNSPPEFNTLSKLWGNDWTNY